MDFGDYKVSLFINRFEYFLLFLIFKRNLYFVVYIDF